MLGYEVVDIVKPEDIDNAKMVIFPGVGNFGQAMKVNTVIYVDIYALIFLLNLSLTMLQCQCQWSM